MQVSARKPWKGAGMEGWVARWYARTRHHDLDDFRRQAQAVARELDPGARVLEVAPGPGYFAIELARLGDFRICGLDISRTFVEIASDQAARRGATIDFRLGNASDMPFSEESFDFVYCSAAFKNFSEPVKALDEMHRVLSPGGRALIVDLRKDVSVDEIETYLDRSGRSRIDAWITGWTFRHMLIKRAYSRDDLLRMAGQSRFGRCEIRADSIGVELRLTKSGAERPH